MRRDRHAETDDGDARFGHVSDQRVDGAHDAAQFGEALQPADAGIAGIDLLADVVER